MTVAFKSPLTSANLNAKFISRTDNQNASGDINFVNGIQIDGIALDEASGVLDVGGTGGIKLPDGTDGQRPSSGNGTLRYNTTSQKFEGYENGAWSNVIAAGTARSYRAATSTDSITTADDTVSYSGASFTATLYTAIGNSGKRVTIIHNGTSLTQVYTLATTGGQTIGGLASGGYVLYTSGETLTLESDGTNWRIISHYAETNWTSYTLVSGTDIKGTTTDPTFATNASVKLGYWKRSGCNMYVRIEYKNPSSPSGAAAGSGSYKFLVPVSQSIDTTKMTAFSTQPPAFGITNCVGSGMVTNSTNFATVVVSVFDANFVRLSGVEPTSTGNVASDFFPMNNNTAGYLFNYIVPISGWQP